MFEVFSRKLTENFSFWVKNVTSPKEAKKYSQIFFSQHVWKGSNPEEIFDLMETTFCQTSELGQILSKYFLLKISDIKLNYAFLVLWSIFEEINWKPLLHQKVNVSEWSQELLRKLFFLNKFENGKILRKIMIWWKQLFLVKPVKWDKYWWKWFSASNDPHTAKLCFSCVLKNFRGNWQKLHFLDQKLDYLRNKLRNTHKQFFS